MCHHKNCLIYKAIQMIAHNIPFEIKTTLLNHLQYNYVWSYENISMNSSPENQDKCIPKSDCFLKNSLIRVSTVCYMYFSSIFANFSPENQHFIEELVVCQTSLDKQCRPRSDCFWRSSLIRVFPVCYSDSIFMNSCPENQHFIWE